MLIDIVFNTTLQVHCNDAEYHRQLAGIQFKTSSDNLSSGLQEAAVMKSESESVTKVLAFLQI